MTTDTASPPAPLVRPAPPRARRRIGRNSRIAFLFVAPYLLFFVVFRVVPALAAIGLSFGDYNIAGKFSFAGIENYQRLFADPLFWNSLGVTALYTAVAVPLNVVFSLFMAQLSNRSIRGMRVYRTFYFLPVVTSLVAAGTVWTWILSAHGPANWFVGLFGVPPIPWLTSGSTVVPSLGLVGVWSGFGYFMLIILAGLLAIPQEYGEAAMVDGANAWQRYWHITLPSLRPTLLVVVILSFIQSFQVFDLIYVMTGGGPVHASYSLVFFLYDQGFHYFDFGYASAAGVILFLITFGVSAIQRRIFGDQRGEA
ncbi:carbohydrate ABC transporter permease [Pseudolysinimonas sp.]|uniref:carbohydrate ABC transporter permease n=1 Tax=Pseudolysinimonas sp. TaxID=2680009 RepID=UPI003F7CFE24